MKLLLQTGSWMPLIWTLTVRAVRFTDALATLGTLEIVLTLWNSTYE